MKQHFFKRKGFANEAAATVSALMVCAERPDVDVVEQIIGDVIEEAPVALAEYLYAFYEQRKTWDKESFGRSMHQLRSLIDHALENEAWAPSEALQKKLAETKLSTIDQVAAEYTWMDELEEQIRSIRYCHLRSIAKKGVDLDGTRHCDGDLKPIDDPASLLRIEAAHEVLSQRDIHLQAKEILKRAVASNKEPIEIFCMRPVKDYDNPTQSYNFLTATYETLLREAIKKTAADLYPGKHITVIDQPILMLTTTNRTDASPFGRILKQPLFDIPTNLEGKHVVIIDDHVNAGAFAATLASQAHDVGANILGVFVYSRHPNSKSLTIDDEIRQALQQTCDAKKLDHLLEGFGLSIDTLTNREGLTLLAILTDGNDEQGCAHFTAISDRLNGKHHRIVSGIKDDLTVELAKPAETIEGLENDIQQLLKAGCLR